MRTIEYIDFTGTVSWSDMLQEYYGYLLGTRILYHAGTPECLFDAFSETVDILEKHPEKWDIIFRIECEH